MVLPSVLARHDDLGAYALERLRPSVSESDEAAGDLIGVRWPGSGPVGLGSRLLIQAPRASSPVPAVDRSVNATRRRAASERYATARANTSSAASLILAT